MAGQRGRVGRLENLQHRRIAPFGLVSNLRTPKGSRPSGFGSTRKPCGPEQSTNITHRTPNRQASGPIRSLEASQKHCCAMAFNEHGQGCQQRASHKQSRTLTIHQHSPQGSPSPLLEAQQRFNAGPQKQRGARTVARDTDKQAEPGLTWSSIQRFPVPSGAIQEPPHKAA